MRIVVRLVVELDAAKWTEFSSGELRQTPAEVRADVRGYVLNAVQQLVALEDADAEVSA